MSYGYVRTMSPAAKSARRIAQGAGRYKRLRNLKIGEVSSVDSAANPLAKVTFMKADQEPPPMNLITLCKRATEAAASGAIDSLRFDQIYKAAAQEMFPTESEAGAISKFMKTGIGAEMLRVHVAMPTIAQAAALQSVYGDNAGLQFDAVAKLEEIHKAKTPKVSPYSPGGQQSGSDSFEAAVRQHMARHNVSRKEAIRVVGTKAHQAERQARESGQFEF
jgi:hypothetical protein